MTAGSAERVARAGNADVRNRHCRHGNAGRGRAPFRKDAETFADAAEAPRGRTGSGIAGAALLAAAVVTPLHAWAAQEDCTPDSGYNSCVRFTVSGGDQAFTVPDGVTRVDVKLWGAGGGGASGASATYLSGVGGGGAFASGGLAVAPGEVLTVVVGAPGTASGLAGTYGGGAGGDDTSSSNFDGASGGGRSALSRGGTELATAGGGGGSAAATVSAANTQFAESYAGGGDQDAQWNTSPCVPGTPAGRGTASAGGAAGTGTADRVGTPGSALAGGAGGNSINPNSGGGGGGGGGYFGGGGGAGQQVGNLTCNTNPGNISPGVGQDGGGGGGASYLSGSVLGGSTAPGDRQAAAATGDAQYVGGVGTGGSRAGSGGPGLVVIQFNGPVDVTMTVSAVPASVRTGATVAYTLTVGNAGALVANDVNVNDAPGAGLDCTTVSPTAECTASGGAQCPGGGASGSVPVATLLGAGAVVPVLPPAGQVQLVFQCTVTASGQ